MPTPKDRAERRERHSQEVEASQAALRRSIKETERLVDESDEMLRRHRNELEAGDALSHDAQRLRKPAVDHREKAADSASDDTGIGLQDVAVEPAGTGCNPAEAAAGKATPEALLEVAQAALNASSRDGVPPETFAFWKQAVADCEAQLVNHKPVEKQE